MRARPARSSATPSGSRLSHSFFFNDRATTEIYTLSLHDALPISLTVRVLSLIAFGFFAFFFFFVVAARSEEHTSELQSHSHLVCRLLLLKTQHGMDEWEYFTDPEFFGSCTGGRDRA